tara:strand:- start:133 stop:582 length:450 start_codon:yes stop_codon:yes gene_type:complete
MGLTPTKYLGAIMRVKMKTPLGLIFRTEYIRTLKSIWSIKKNRDYVIDISRLNVKNIKPVIVIDDNDYSSECYLINTTLDGFTEHDNVLLCRKVEAIAEYMKTKYTIQKSNKSIKDKEKYCSLNEVRNLRHQELETKDEKDFNKFVKEL